MEFKRIFTPITINGMEVKNRVIMPAMNTLFTPDGYVNDRFKYYFWKRAEGGVGLVTVGGAVIDEYGSTYAMMHLEDDKFIPGYKEFTDGMHERGAKVAVQLFQAGRYGYSSANNGKQPIAPSAVYSGYSHETPRTMTKEEIKETIQKGAEAAERAKRAGFDMVELSGSAGYLISQFISPLTNLRTDEYGGSWANRMRFPKEYVKAVRKAVGPDYPIGMRIAGHDLVPGSNTNKDAVRFAKEMEAAGVDFLSVTGGWHESKVPQITAELPRGGWDFLVANIKAAVNIPVAVSNRINDPVVAERLLATGVADMVSLGRPCIADPEWCNKAEAGRPELIRKCLACNQGCLARAFFDQPIECLVNGQLGREYIVKDAHTVDKKNILVIGGGPVGCEFAIRAAEQGHQVTLWEQDDRLGGQLHLASAPPHKQEFGFYVDYFANMLKEQKVTVCLNKTADVDSVKAGGFDLVVTAMGRGPAPEIALNNKGNIPVCTANDILKGDVMAGKNVLVIGGGTVGCETAQYMADEASVSPEQVFHMMQHRYESPDEVYALMNTCRRNITVVDIKKIGQGFEAGTAWPILKDLDRLGVKRYPFTSVVELDDGKAVLEVHKTLGNTKTQVQTVEIPCDTVVMAVGARPKDDLYQALIAEGMDVRNIGDSYKVTNVLYGIRQACELVEELAGIEHPAQ